MTDHTPVLRVEDLSVRRGERLAVEQVSCQLARETDTALVGPNGAGKSSLVGALLGLLPLSSGSVRILGHALGPAGELPRAVRSQIAYLPQSLALQGRFPLTVGEFVGFGVDPPGLSLAWLGNRRRTEAVQRALERTGCQDLAERRLSALSGGQLKRVLLAFCVVRPRQLLVLDEAQAGLDAPSNERFQELLLELRRIMLKGHRLLHVRLHGQARQARGSAYRGARLVAGSREPGPGLRHRRMGAPQLRRHTLLQPCTTGRYV